MGWAEGRVRLGMGAAGWGLRVGVGLRATRSLLTCGLIYDSYSFLLYLTSPYSITSTRSPLYDF